MAMAIVWLLVGVGLLLVELRHLAFYALFASVGCFGGAVVALAAPSAIGLQGGVAIALAVAGVIAVRPAMSRAFHQRRGGHVARGVHGGLIGQEALTLDEVGSLHERGHVRLSGERWLAVSGDGDAIAPGTPVVVTAVEGTTLTVWPSGGSLPELKGRAADERPVPPDDVPPGGADGRTT
jgi:membrane protein implicated in regulation of membrane protease activity